LKTPPRGEKATARTVAEKVANAMRARIAARSHRDTQRRKTALESSSMPAKLVDCRSTDVGESELFIVEGDSALGTAKSARNSKYQALLPIRGKILNVQKSSLSDMLKNAECASIIQVIGAGSGRSFDLDQARYGKIILMSDADVDGAHIRCLLLTLINRYMRPLLEDGRVFAAVPPLHRIEVINAGSKANEVTYTYSDQEMKTVVADSHKKGKRVKDPVQRYKGLGEMDSHQLRETTMDSGRRTLRRMTVSDAEDASDVFNLLMGSEVAPRKEFIVSGAQNLDRERIDA
jgi:DNA gyrase subunit B